MVSSNLVEARVFGWVSPRRGTDDGLLGCAPEPLTCLSTLEGYGPNTQTSARDAWNAEMECAVCFKSDDSHLVAADPLTALLHPPPMPPLTAKA